MKPTQKFRITRIIAVMFFLVSISIEINAQVHQRYSIAGQLADKNSALPLSFATVALKRSADSALVTGVSSGADGKFILEPVERGKYELVISAIGYETSYKNIDLSNDVETGTILVQEKSFSLPEIVISSERRKAENGADKTVWLMNEVMYDASSSGTDLLGHIPGINVDMMKNISLAGSSNIIILVDGRERERNFVSQLDASKIDKVEVIDNPGAGYDAGVTGVINIILKKDRKSGISGYVNAELPSSRSEIYLFPSYSLSYGTGKINLYTSYNGEFAYFDIIERTTRTFLRNEITTNIFSEQSVRQKNYSHRFHYGFDYYLNEKNQFNFYAWYNPWSREFDGSIKQTVEANGSETGLSGTRNDTDNNSSSFYSAYYRHNFAKPGNKLELDLSNYFYKGKSSTDFNIDKGDEVISTSAGVMPAQNTTIIKIDLKTSITEKIMFDGGIKSRFQSMKDRQSDDFNYHENVYAAYGSLTYQISRYTIKAGMRVESSSSELEGSFNKKYFLILPGATLNYRLNSKQDINLNYSKTVNRPALYQLNPNIVSSDVFSAASGNPFLKPDLFRNLSLKYSATSGKNYYSVQVYYRERNDAISNYTFVNENGIFETGVSNLGNIKAWGLELTGSLKLFKILSFNPYFSLYDLRTSTNSFACQYGIGNRNKGFFETGISVIAGFKHGITTSLRFHYSTPKSDIQTITFEDALYFISLEKSFFKNYKVALGSALPFFRSFTYLGYEINGSGFRSRTESNIRLSRIPLWITFRYQFNSGKKINSIDRDKEEISNKPVKGF